MILSMYSVGMVFQCFTIDSFHKKLGSKKTYLFGVSCGAIVSSLALTLNYTSLIPFICFAVLLRFIDGARETQFEVVFFVYVSENVLECTTERM